METVIRPVVNTPDEIFAGHKLWFVPVHGCDAISATANAPGFTPLIAIARQKWLGLFEQLSPNDKWSTGGS